MMLLYRKKKNLCNQYGKPDREVYLDQVKSQEELADLISVCLKEKTIISFVEFKLITETICSDMFLCVMCFSHWVGLSLLTKQHPFL